MNNYRRSKIFGKKEKVNLFVFLCLTLVIVFLIYFTFSSTNMDKNDNQLAKNETLENSIFEQELNVNVNENIKDNAIQVKDDKEKEDTKQEFIANNTGNTNNSNEKQELSKDNSLSQTGNTIVETSDKKDVVENKGEFAQETNDETSQVSANNISFVSPVDGTIIREYTTDTIFSKTLNTWRTREGMDFKAEVGTPVVAVLGGVVEKIDNDLTERGEYIIIKHDDGFKTMYTNLDEEVKVVSGQKVRKGEIIGTVGNSAGNYFNEEYGSHLNFVMYLDNEEVNPSEYIKFK